ncbi:MAG: hypothetical protein BWY80_00950 [Firmicutes bacterium ADurb.Bin456]|nr:MAG: hypothetical protein BWY80_00950 [Firmicutes bacterium ADurb.Bin456]
MVMTPRLWEIAMARLPVCLATRSAVRWRIPVSVEGVSWLGTNWVLAAKILLVSLLKIIAPSILASSYKLEGEQSALITKPPSVICITSGVSPTIMSPPFLARRIFSRPSRSGVPGATVRRTCNNVFSARSSRKSSTSNL